MFDSSSLYRRCGNVLCFALCALSMRCAVGQTEDPILKVTRKSVLNFKVGGQDCLRATYLKSDPSTITVSPVQGSDRVISRKDIVQVSQGNAILLSNRSSWLDVMRTEPVVREKLVLHLNTGKRVAGKLAHIDESSVTLRQPFGNKSYPKSAISRVDYIRDKPASDEFLYVLEEAPYAAIFYPEFYSRLVGAEGRGLVHLYNASLPEDNSHLCTTPVATLSKQHQAPYP